jgi:NADPH:quinone reductase-like Zn-dependent oxidoreductase
MSQPSGAPRHPPGFLMRAVVLTGVGGLDRLTWAEVPAPEVRAPHEVRVRVQAAALNRLDLFVANGLPGVAYAFPQVVGSDGAGVVESVGAAVTSVRPGDRVMINPGISCGTCAQCVQGEESLCDAFQLLGEHRNGTMAEFVVVPDRNLALVPGGMDWPQAAAFSLATLTAWHMVMTRARARPGETVLIWGVGGGVALAAVQVAVLAGARVIATSSSTDKLAVAQALGAGELVDHSTEDVVARVRALTANRGAEVIIDSVGEPTWSSSLRLLCRGGRLVTCGATGGPQVALDLRRLFWHQWSLLGSTMGSRAEYAEVVRLAGEGRLWPHVDRVVPLDRAMEAFERLARGEQVGKLVVDLRLPRE